jgi:hypothetical protein
MSKELRTITDTQRSRRIQDRLVGMGAGLVGSRNLNETAFCTTSKIWQTQRQPNRDANTKLTGNSRRNQTK